MKKVNRNITIYYSSKEAFNFKTFEAIRSFGENIYSGKITINKANVISASKSGLFWSKSKTGTGLRILTP